jgi:cell division protein FtsQ
MRTTDRGNGTRTVGSRTPRGLASAAPRFQERALANRRRPWQRIAWALGAVAVVALLAWLVWFSPVLSVRAVEVSGVGAAEQKAIHALADSTTGQPLARVDVGAIQQQVRSLPTVADARVQRSWPSTLEITAVPRTPALVLKNPQGQLQVVDRTGFAFATTATAPPGIPLVTATGTAGTSEGAVRAALSVIDALPTSLAKQVAAIEVSSADLVSFKLGAVSVIWGGQDAGERKVSILEALLGTKPAVIDVSAPDTPVTR